MSPIRNTWNNFYAEIVSDITTGKYKLEDITYITAIVLNSNIRNKTHKQSKYV